MTYPPIATYRLQFTSAFQFDDATEILPYLKELGISHVYASPLTTARAGSTHGYDVVDPCSVNPALGGEEAFSRLSLAMREAGLELIVDFVPNHMGVHHADNPWWLDMLEWGEASPFARFFDVDWRGLQHRNLHGILLPILGSSYADVLNNGELVLRFDPPSGTLSVWYFEHRLPIAPKRYGQILAAAVDAAQAQDTPAGRRIRDIAHEFSSIRMDRIAADRMKQALASVEGAADILQRGLDQAYGAGPDRPAQAHALHAVLERQNYRVALWRLATTEINYRRFFDINTLAGVRIEDPKVFAAFHAWIKSAVARGQIQGIRLDHIDGLRDPARYCERLLRLVRTSQSPPRQPFYIVVEKILGEGEALPELPGVDGTTGYEWLNVLSHLLVDANGLPRLDEIWRDKGGSASFERVVEEAKLRVMHTMLASEFNVLVRMLSRIAAGHYSTRDYSAERLKHALEQYVLRFPVYRTYVTTAGISDADRKLIDETMAKVRADWFGSDLDLLDFLQSALTLDLISGPVKHHSVPRMREFAFKFQQFTGPMMAKSLEDTAFYRFHRLIAFNEVGGDPASSALPPADFHKLMRQRARDWPHGMTATATHDTKRAEDARTRILALSELADDWSDAVGRWDEWNAGLPGYSEITPAHRYLLYQTLVGAWPSAGSDSSFIDRICAFALKAAREGKQQTSWLNPREKYEKALEEYVRALLDPDRNAQFLADFATFAERTGLLGALNSLTQVTLKMTVPGVPDIYQGTEYWDLSLVDPDNRRPVDFVERRHALANIADQPYADLCAAWRDGRIKLALTRDLLALRRDKPALFAQGDHVGLTVSGAHRDNAVAYVRCRGSEAVVVVALRHFAGLTEGGRRWPDVAHLEADINISGLDIHGFEARSTIGIAELLNGATVCAVPARITRAFAATQRAHSEHGQAEVDDVITTDA